MPDTKETLEWLQEAVWHHEDTLRSLQQAMDTLTNISFVRGRKPPAITHAILLIDTQIEIAQDAVKHARATLREVRDYA